MANAYFRYIWHKVVQCIHSPEAWLKYLRYLFNDLYDICK